MPQRLGGRAVREQPLEEVYLQQGLEGSEMENLHREEKGGQHFRRGNRSEALEAVRNSLPKATDWEEKQGMRIRQVRRGQTKESLEKTGWARAGHNVAGQRPLRSFDKWYKGHRLLADLASKLSLPLLQIIVNLPLPPALTTGFRIISTLA